MDLNARLTEFLRSLNEDVPAPTAPPPVRRPGTKPTTPATPRPSRPDPFRPPQPAVQPRPKAKKKQSEEDAEIAELAALIGEAYEDEAHPTTQGFWRNVPPEHPFSQHPTLTKHGAKLSKSGYEHVKGRLGDQPVNTMRVLQQIIQAESKHKEQLEQLAVDLVAQLFGIPLDMMRAEIGKDMPAEPEEEREEVEITPEIRKQINKRLTVNTLTQGSAVHLMMTAHHLIDKKIRAIDPQLLQLYNQLAAGSVHQYWLIDIPAILAQLKGAQVGASHVEYAPSTELKLSRQSGGREEEETEVPQVVAVGICFPVLVQELVKGVMELLSHHGLAGMDEPTTRTVLKHADAIEHEPYLIQIGPELWRRFLKVIPREVKMAEVMAAFNKRDPDEVEEIVDAVVDNPERAADLLRQIIS